VRLERVDTGKREREQPRARVPVRLVELESVPADVRLTLASQLAAQEPAAPKARVPAAKRDHLLEEAEEVLVALREFPVEPGDLVVLAVGAVVAALGAADLVAGDEHRHTLR